MVFKKVCSPLNKGLKHWPNAILCTLAIVCILVLWMAERLIEAINFFNMYGLVNNSFKQMIIASYGADTWRQINIKAGLEVLYFLNDEGYPDETTYSIVASAAELLNLPVADLLHAFGKYWVTETASKRYASLMAGTGANVKEFLTYLPHLHDRMTLSFPRLKPPVFKVSAETGNSIELHYISEREGLSEFVAGLLLGIGVMFKQEVFVERQSLTPETGTHDIFTITF